MVRIRLLTISWSSPLGSFKRGQEIDVDGDLGASLVATNQAEYVQPPEPEPIEPEPPESGEWTSTPEEAAAAVRPKREYRKRQQQPAPELLPQP